jgi:hypothetical protein
MAVGVAAHTGSRRDLLRHVSVHAFMRQGPGVVRHTGSERSVAASTACGSACGRKALLVFWAKRQVFDENPQRDGGRSRPRRRRGPTVAGQHVPWRGKEGPKAPIGEEKERPFARDWTRTAAENRATSGIVGVAGASGENLRAERREARSQRLSSAASVHEGVQRGATRQQRQSSLAARLGWPQPARTCTCVRANGCACLAVTWRSRP